jgi:hypothetical protein
VTADGDAVAVGHAHGHHRIDSRLRVGRQLGDIGVVGLGPVLADDRHGGVVQIA